VNALFVYGLLKPGFSLHHVAEPFVTKVIPGRSRGRLYDAGVPAARFDEDGLIEGFVLWLDRERLDEAFRILDDLEDEGTEYRRVPIEVQTEGGTVSSWAYEYLLPVEGRPAAGTAWFSLII
jgi:gamma-glutamylcyclotransferase (GGCT)/AIG2-like uncharacterized protein YtfP